MSHLGITDEYIVWFAARRGRTMLEYWPELMSLIVNSNFTTPQEGVEDLCSNLSVSAGYKHSRTTVVGGVSKVKTSRPDTGFKLEG